MKSEPNIKILNGIGDQSEPKKQKSCSSNHIHSQTHWYLYEGLHS